MSDEEKYPLLKNYFVEFDDGDTGLDWPPKGRFEYVFFLDGGDEVTLDGSFTADFLEQLAKYMRDHGPLQTEGVE